ncbi:aldolase/citrate lyase family protein, partial [candidate division KSB1 bacterium]
LDPILEVNDIDVLFLGPYDLSGSLNLLGDIDHPEVKKAIDKFLEKTEGKVARGIYAKTLEEVERRLNQGFLFIMTAADFSLLEEATEAHWNGIGEIRKKLGTG